MKIDHNIKLEQSQKLIITPELKQAIKLLQMSKTELETYVEQELKSNPVLEKESSNEEAQTKDTADRTENEASENEGNDNNDKYDLDWQEYFADSSDVTGGAFQSSSYTPQNQDSFEVFTSSETTFIEYLNFQLSLLDIDTEIREVCEFIVGSLDSNGYLSIYLTELSKFTDYSIDKLQEALELVQTLDPLGVAARDLKECLLIQVYEKIESGNISKKVIPLIENHLSDIAENKIKNIASSLEISTGEVQSMVDFIKTLNPKPAASYFTGEKTAYVVPEAFIEKVDDEYIIIMNDNLAPNLRISSSYRNIMNNNKCSETKEFISSRMDSAMWLIKAIEQRRRTIYKVIECIVDIQRTFFEEGVSSLKMLTLNDVAERIDVHESTVSRATANKYVQTPRGIYSLRFFFDSSSSTKVKHIIKQLIDSEDQNNPLSDEKIASILKENEGVEVSRRTVAKYRKEINIPSSSKRKRFSK